MRKSASWIFLSGIFLVTPAMSHPTHLLFDKRGECERQQASVNNFDREFVAEQVFGISNNGEAQVFFLESFQCEFDEANQSWRMVNHMGDPAGVGRAWDE